MLVWGTKSLILNSSHPIKSPKHTQLTFSGNILLKYFEELSDRAQISPDGDFTAYAAGNGKDIRLYVRDNSTKQVLEIYRGLSFITFLRWSPSGKEILFSGPKDTVLKSYIISRFGGKAQEAQSMTEGCFSPEGDTIAGLWNYGFNKTIYLISRSTNQYKKIKIDKPFSWIYSIDWSRPRGKILFLSNSDDDGGISTIWIMNSDGGKLARVLESDKRIRSPRWSPDGNYIYYLEKTDNTFDLKKIDLSVDETSGKPKVIQTGMQAYGFSISNDCKKLCYTKYTSYNNLWKFTSTTKEKTYKAERLTAGTSRYESPVISPDGNQLAYIQNGNIYSLETEKDSIKQLTFLPKKCGSFSWSPDGKNIIFTSDSLLYILGLKDGKISLIAERKFGSPIYWLTDDEIFYRTSVNLDFNIYNLKTKTVKQLINDKNIGYIFLPRLYSDLSTLAVYWNRLMPDKLSRGYGIWLVSFTDYSHKLLSKGSIYPIRWSSDGKKLYAINISDDFTEIAEVTVPDGNYKSLFQFTKPVIDPFSIDITQDGKTIICTIDETASDVWMIENFDPEIENESL